MRAARDLAAALASYTPADDTERKSLSRVRSLLSQARDPFTRDAEEKLSRHLQTRVRIARRRRGGRIEIAFGSEEELIGIFERLTAK